MSSKKPYMPTSLLLNSPLPKTLSLLLHKETSFPFYSLDRKSRESTTADQNFKPKSHWQEKYSNF